MGLGKTYSTKYLLDSNNSSGVAGQVLSTTSTGIDWVNANTVPGAGLWIESGNNIYNSNSGNVGIGTTSPNHKLQVEGGSAESIINLTTTGYANGLDIIEGTDGHAAIWLRENSYMHFATNSVERMRITNGGNVGIGTTSPGRKLTVQGPDNGTMQLRLMGTASQTSYWEIGRESASTGQFRFIASRNGTVITPMVIDDQTGNVGIGTSSPNVLGFLETSLNIAAGSSSSTTLQQAGLVISGSSDAGDGDDFSYLSFTNYQSTLSSDRVAEIRIKKAGSNVDTGQFHFYTANGTALNESMVLSESGLLKLSQYGAGTLVTDASGNITVSSGGGAGGPFLPLAGGIMTGTGSISMPDNFSLLLGGGIMKIFNDGSNSIIRSQGEPLFIDANDITFRGYSPYNSLMTIKSTGNVGIGTTSPGEKLEINTAAQSAIMLRARYNANYYTDYGSNQINFTGSNQSYGIKNNGTFALFINSSSNVGIGTTNPAQNFVVSNSTNGQGVEIIPGNSGVIQSYNRASSVYLPLLFDALRVQPRATEYFTVSTGSGFTERMRITSAGKVGIGITAPTANLDVRVAGIGTSAGDESNSIIFQGDRHDWIFKQIRTGAATDWNSTTLRLQTRVDSTDMSSIDFVTDASYNRHIDINTASNSFSTRFAHNGNVGIGTTAPTQRLHVVDGLRVTGAYYDSSNDPGTPGQVLSSYASGTNWVGASGLPGGPYLPLAGGTLTGNLTGTTIGLTGGITANHFRTNAGNTDYNLLTRDSTGNTLFVQAAQSNTNQPIAKFSYGSATVNAGTAVLQVSKDNSHFVNCSVGVGTTSPQVKLDVNASSNNSVARFTSTGANARILVADNSDTFYLGVESSKFYIGGDSSATTTNLIIDTSGNVGIGTTSPDQKLHVAGTVKWEGVGTSGLLSGGETYVSVSQSANSYDLRLGYDTGDFTIKGDGKIGIGLTNPGSKLTVSSPLSGNGTSVDFQIDGGSGFGMKNLQVEIPNNGSGIRVLSPTTGAGDNAAMSFYQVSSQVGSITMGTSTTSFNTTSDYRLKENKEDISDAIERVKKLKPVKFNWIKEPDGLKVDGFYAHELADIVPEAVTGKKDALDHDGNPAYQAIDQSKIVPLLAAALQQAIDKIEQLEIRIQTIENN